MQSPEPFNQSSGYTISGNGPPADDRITAQGSVQGIVPSTTATSHHERSSSGSSSTTATNPIATSTTHFPSSHDAFGLAASPSSSLALSPKGPMSGLGSHVSSPWNNTDMMTSSRPTGLSSSFNWSTTDSVATVAAYGSGADADSTAGGGHGGGSSNSNRFGGLNSGATNHHVNSAIGYDFPHQWGNGAQGTSGMPHAHAHAHTSSHNHNHGHAGMDSSSYGVLSASSSSFFVGGGGGGGGGVGGVGGVGGPIVRMNRPSLLSLQQNWNEAGPGEQDDQQQQHQGQSQPQNEYVDVQDSEPTTDVTKAQVIRTDSDSEASQIRMELDTGGSSGLNSPRSAANNGEERDSTKASSIARWRNKLEPSPTIRRVHSAFEPINAMARAGAGPGLRLDTNGDTNANATTSASTDTNVDSVPTGSLRGASPVSPTCKTAPFALRRVLSDQEYSSSVNRMMLSIPVANDSRGHQLDSLPDTFAATTDAGAERSRPPDMNRSMGIAAKRAPMSKGKGKAKASFSSSNGSIAGGSSSGEGEARRGAGHGHGKNGPSEASAKSRLLPPSLRATLAAEKDIPGQEIRSEALLQKLILSNPTTQPMTPRPSRRVIEAYHNHQRGQGFASGFSLGPGPRTTSGRFRMSFSQSNNSDSDPSVDGDSSDEDGPFMADDFTVNANLTPGSHHNKLTPVQMLPPTSTSTSTPSWELSGMELDYPSPGIKDVAAFNFARRIPSGKSSMGSLQGNSLTPQDREGDIHTNAVSGQSVGAATSAGAEGEPTIPNTMMGWRESPSASGRSGKRKATFPEDTRYEPYVKRHRSGGSDTISSVGSVGASMMLAMSPSQRSSVLPAYSTSSSSSSYGMCGNGNGYSNGNGSSNIIGNNATAAIPMPMPMPSSPAMSVSDIDMSGPSTRYPHPRSRGGSPAAMTAAQMAVRTAVSPVASSPLSNGTFRPTLGMGGGFGMLLLNKRNQNSVSTGTGLMLGSTESEGEMAVAEGIGEMDVTSADTGEDDDIDDKMMFD